MAIYHNGIKIENLYHNGKKIHKIFHNGKCIYASIAVGESLYNGIPSNGIMLYGVATVESSSNPLGISGDSIHINAPLSSCPNGIKIQFSTNSYGAGGSRESYSCNIPDINIPKGSSSGSSFVRGSIYSGDDSNITASINGSTLSFSVNNDNYNQVDAGTAIHIAPDGFPNELLAITSITAY